MSTIGAANACCACSTLAEYEETNKATSAAPEKTDAAEQNRQFDWQKNSENLRKLAKADQDEVARSEGASQAARQASDSSD